MPEKQGSFEFSDPGADPTLFRNPPRRRAGRRKEPAGAEISALAKSASVDLRHAQEGSKHPDAKPLKGFKGAGRLEIVEDHDGNTYRAVYTVRFGRAVYMLHAFQKRSTKGIKTPKHEIELVKKRLKMAEEHYAEWIKTQPDEEEASGS